MGDLVVPVILVLVAQVALVVQEILVGQEVWFLVSSWELNPLVLHHFPR